MHDPTLPFARRQVILRNGSGCVHHENFTSVHAQRTRSYHSFLDGYRRAHDFAARDLYYDTVPALARPFKVSEIIEVTQTLLRAFCVTQRPVTTRKEGTYERAARPLPRIA